MVRFSIRASLPATHRIRIDARGTLEPLHAHNWRVEAWLQTAVAERGTALRHARTVLGAWVERHRGRCFNDVPPFDRVNPTAEEVARSLFEVLAEGVPEADVERIEIGEAAGFSASYWPRDAPRG